MRIKLRSPSSNAVLTLPEDATVATLAAEIQAATAIAAFEIRLGFPPKPLQLSEFADTQLLTELPVKLNGEQLTISDKNGGSGRSTPVGAVKETPPAEAAVYQPAPAKPKAVDTPFSFTAGTAQPRQETQRPLGLTRAAPKFNKDDPPDVKLASGRGTVVLRVMEDDNSCLFRAISYVTSRSQMTVEELRGLVASSIQADPERFNKVTLEQDPDEYCKWIQMPDSWGGGIEIAILASFFDVEIVAIDVASGSTIRENQGRPLRVVLVYSGIHYDSVALSPPGASNHDIENDEIQFSNEDEEVLDAAMELCRRLREKRYFTDTKNFDLRCNVCKAGVKGERGAQAHAKETGHYDFGEFVA